MISTVQRKSAEENNVKSKKKKAWAQDELENWGDYMAAKKAKLEEQFLEEAKAEYQEASSLFRGVAIFVNGYTDPTSDELRRLMMKHGGIYHHYLRPQQTTHMIASNLPYSKIVTYMKSKNPLPLCKPSWITDSIKAGKILDFRKYLLYSQCTKTQPHLLNIFKSTNSNNSTLDNSKSLKTSFFQKSKLQSPIVSETPVGPSTSKSTPLNKFPTEEEFSNSPNLQFSKSSTPKVNSAEPLRIVTTKLDLSRQESPLKKSPKLQNSESLNKVSSDENTTEVSKSPIKNITNTIAASENNNVKKSPIKNSKSSYSSNCSKNSDFISEFYNNSRLHHIATMGATFKDYINELRDKSNGKFPGLNRLIEECRLNRPGPSTRNDSDSEDDIFAIDSTPNEDLPENVIMHIDMDCFFVSVGIRNRPELKGLPVAVTHAKGNKPSTSTDRNQELSYSEIASCSYEARKFGLKNGMFLGQALKLCPNLKTIKYDFEGYKEVSYALYDTISSYTLNIEAVSCDEMYADCSEILSKTGLTPLEFADIIRKEIKEKTKCPVSTGFGVNKLQARLATKKAKPDGKFYLKNEDVLKYIGTLNAKDLPGVGYSTTSKLNAMNVKTCADLQSIALPNLQKEFGKKTGEMLYNMCRGIDNSKLSVEHVRKSISAEVNYGIRFENHSDAEEFLNKLSVEICTRLKKANAKGKCITLKLMVRAKEAPKETIKFMGHGICDHFTRSKNFIAPVDELSIITKEILILWNQMQQVPEDIRGIGIQMSRLEIVKHKSNTGGLMNFINKAKVTNSEEKIEESTNISKQIIVQEEGKPSCPKLESKKDTCIPEITNCKLTSKKSSFQDRVNSVFLSEDKLILPSQDIDDSILNELPEDIRREIEANKRLKSKSDKPKKESSQGATKSIQTKQELFFRERKPNVPRGKVKLPPMKEIDMAVLIELPEDIRNEILNEYKTNKSSEIPSTSTKPTENKLNKEEKFDEPEIKLNKNIRTESGKKSNPNLNHLTDERDFSFSQVDPEFLAALPEDMRDDVQMYCMMKKREKNIAKKINTNVPKTNVNSDKWSMFKQTKNSKSLKPKSTRGRKPKSVLGRNNGVATRVKEDERDKNELEIIKQVDKKEEANVNEEKEKKEIIEIISHIRSFPVKDLKIAGQEKALSTLVKYMFTLSVDQVRMQIQNWVFNSDTVNEIDILSLATYLSMLPGKRLIEDLHVLLKCMHRCITKSGSCVWHETYRKIVEHVQHYMQIEYNSDLMVPSIGCNLHKCKG